MADTSLPRKGVPADEGIAKEAAIKIVAMFERQAANGADLDGCGWDVEMLINSMLSQARQETARECADVCEERASNWRHKNVAATTDYMRKKTWDKSHESDECAGSIRARFKLEGK